ncbi:uncharacterized protein DDB_G0283697 [Nasonia vitripennis]|uniref:hydroxyisourate hydrolase n=1 Tax=Nasonia vitripennis TaxID=7425 RepID=A0A7M7LMV9_NASVI|nr:uncharacterized protein DDB_G0283697 [Nasonia vitripennis]
MEEVKTEEDNVIRIVEVKTKEPKNTETQEIVRLTPTGKISHAKTRVYTQRYRKEWEHMADFKDWLTSVPYQATRAFCKYCQRNLHAHRLSLLKHMCTLKHQRAAVQYNKREAAQQQNSNDINYVVESLDDDDEDNEDEDDDYNEDNEGDIVDDDDINNETTEYLQDVGEELNIEGEVQEEVIEESEGIHEPVFKKLCIEKNEAQDTLAQAMSHVHSDYSTENEEPIELQMEVESVEEDHEEDNLKPYQYVKYSTNQKDQTDIQKEAMNKTQKEVSDEAIKTLIAESKGNSQAGDNAKKVLFFSSGGKTYSLVKSKLPPVVMNQFNDKNFTVVAKLAKQDVKLKDTTSSTNVTTSSTASASQDSKKNLVATKTTSMTTKSVLLKKPIVSTHVLETSKGIPVCGLQVSLYKLQDGRWTFVHESITTANGFCNDFSSCAKNSLTTGRYKFHYDVEKYYNMRKQATIYPFIEIVFDIKDPNASYHIPLLVSPFSYSTFKDSPR